MNLCITVDSRLHLLERPDLIGGFQQATEFEYNSSINNKDVMDGK